MNKIYDFIDWIKRLCNCHRRYARQNNPISGVSKRYTTNFPPVEIDKTKVRVKISSSNFEYRPPSTSKFLDENPLNEQKIQEEPLVGSVISQNSSV